MIDYNFDELIQDKMFAGIPLIEKIVNSLPESLNEEKLIDTIWGQISTAACEKPSYIDPGTVNALKYDIIMSLYVSAKYTTLEEHEYKSIASELKDIRTSIQDDSHGDSFKTGLDNRRRALKEIYQIGGNMLISGQLFENNPLLYLKQFWDDGSEEYPEKFKCFNLDDYISYIWEYSSWPFTPDNCNGMSFFKYFNGIRLMTTKDRNSKNDEYMKRAKRWDFYSNSNTNADFEDHLSAYILEELFAPVSFIENVLLHMKSFEKIFSKTKNADREQSIILMAPLFKLPRSLWKRLSGDYIAALKKYIASPSNIDFIGKLSTCMYKTIYHSQYTFPYLKILLANVLYTQKKKSLKDITTILEKYIENNIGNFDYFTALKKSMLVLAEYCYPTKAKTPLDIEGYKKLHPEFESKGNDSKRNNFSIESYEINFTHTFFCFKYTPKFKDDFLCQQGAQKIETPINIDFLLCVPPNPNYSLPSVNQLYITIQQPLEISFPLKIPMGMIEPPIIIQPPFTIQTPYPIQSIIQSFTIMEQITVQSPFYVQAPFTLRPPFSILPPFTILRIRDMQKELTDYIIKNIKYRFSEAEKVTRADHTPNYLSQKQKGFIMFPLKDESTPPA